MKEKKEISFRHFEYYIAQRMKEYRARYNHEQSWNRLLVQLHRRKMHRIYIRTSVAASFLLLIWGVGHYWKEERQIEAVSVHETETFDFPETGSKKAMLTLESGEQVDLSVKEGVISDGSTMVVNNESCQKLVYEKVDAAGSVPQMNTLEIPRGGEYQLVLADGSKIWMNAESSLRYPTFFNGDRREVYLRGEAFFEVKADKEHPFVVHVGGNTVEVLGTSFNVSAYPGFNVCTTLESGSVKVCSVDSMVVLQPNQQAVIDKDIRQITTKSVPSRLFTSWAKGNYEFRNTTLEEIASQLSRWYDVDIHFKDNELKGKRFAGIIFRNEELNFAIEVIEEVSDVHFMRENGVVYIEKKRGK